MVLQQRFGATIAHLEIAQRGRVVILMGQSLDSRLVRQISKLALEVEGADFVEVFDAALPQVA
jgi:hypothetical protein